MMNDRPRDDSVSPSTDSEFWEQADIVLEFAGRAVDHRLVRIIESYSKPERIRVLDLGCAGGRNTEFLSARGFDVHALDRSRAMVQRTRQRVEQMLGRGEAERRVQVGVMQDLSRYPAASFDLVLALGTYHNAQGGGDFDRTLAETARVLVPGGKVLVAIFSPASAPKGERVTRVAATERLYAGFDSGPLYLLDASELDSAMAAHGLRPEEATATVKAATADGFRVSINGFYAKRG